MKEFAAFVAISCIQGDMGGTNGRNASVRERAPCMHNAQDRYAVAVKKEGTFNRHLPRKLSSVFTL